MSTIKGHCDEGFRGVAAQLEEFINSEEELGASVTVNLDGVDVVNIWGGYADAGKSKPWERDTISCIFSTTKTVSALAVLKLVDQGLIDVDEKVSKYWPEFAANGKLDIRVRHVLSHTCGLPGFHKQVSLEDVCDVEKATTLLAADSPWWEPGTASGYHSLTLGPLIGELVRRVSGKSLTAFIAEDIARPLEADFQLGVLEKDLSRVSPVIPPPGVAPRVPPPPGEEVSMADKVFANPPMHAAFANTEIFQKSEWGAGNGHSNASAIARIMSVISLNGKVGKTQFLSSSTIDHIFRQQAFGTDLVLNAPICWGIGYALPMKDTILEWLPVGRRVCTWGGYGGSFVVMDLDRRLTIAYVMNKMSAVGIGSGRGKAYIAAAYRAIGEAGF
ncbi:hypothetical protein LTR84_000552 [Exophiala bonariae]|uniref:Beta-lactamase-related domain-containing protein n=1 Tax=Exophiala bonariae TaxID=1690606 RepID=A0AAV9NUL0_9EURO|nr:hypothetical protein LTR84_000552 [Exophiala bonariae]